MTALDDLHLAAEHYAEAQGKKAPLTKAAADDAQLRATALDFALHEGYTDPVAPPSPGPVDTAYDRSVANLQRPQGSFGPVKRVTTLASMQSALNALQAGDDLLVSGVTIPGTLRFPHKFSRYARVTFDHSCVFSGYQGAWQQSDNIYLPDTHYLQLVFEQGCKIINEKGNRNVAVFGGDHIVLDGFSMGHCGGTCFQSSPVNAPLTNFWYRGEVFDGGHNAAAWDPHNEKGSGVHGMYLANGKNGLLHTGLIALYTHDHSAGAGDLQFGHDTGKCGPILPKDVELYIKAKNNSFVSKIQTGGNATQVWGSLGTGIVYKVIEADNLQGKAFWCNALGGTPEIKILAGIATRCVQNPRWKGQSPWDKHPGVTYPNPAALTPRP